MPVVIPITVADPPAAPPGYTLCAFEVRHLADGFRATFPGTTDGYEIAARHLVNAVAGSLAADSLPGFRLAVVAWWVDASLDGCPNGRERLVSGYDAGKETWGEWLPEGRVGDAGKQRSVPHAASDKARSKWAKLQDGGGRN